MILDQNPIGAIVVSSHCQLETTKNRQVKCFTCGKRGHVQKNCKTNKNTLNKPTLANEKTPGLYPLAIIGLISVDLNCIKTNPSCWESGRRTTLRARQTI